jgi:signal transduction histidine kinase
MRHWTIRTRLTVFYGGLFLLAGATLLAATYLLVQHSVDARLDGAATTVVRADGAAWTTSQESARIRDDTLTSLLTQGAVALAVVGVVVTALGWLIADRLLRPLHRITDTARRVADSHLHERIGLDGPHDEVKELADTFDSMLERLDRSFDGQRRFVANASHELHTPLAINRTLLEVAMRRPDAPPQVCDLAATLLAVNARHERLIDGLLTLARSEQGVTENQPVDLADIARHVTECQPDSAVEITGDYRPAPVTGDPVLLERIVQNLVQNAIDYNTPEGWVSVSTATRGNGAELTVRNCGPVVPAYEIPGLFEPFRRLQDRVGTGRGAGLGLSIVRSVTRAHRGSVTTRPREGGGLVVTVTLPLAADQVGSPPWQWRHNQRSPTSSTIPEIR